jgi:hypothetical protein
MKFALIPGRETGSIVIDTKLYYFDSRQPPGQGERAIVVTPYGEVRAAIVFDAEVSKRYAMMPEDRPGDEGRCSRLQVAYVGTVTREIELDETGFPMRSHTAAAISDWRNSGRGLRERVLDAIKAEAQAGRYGAEIDLERVSPDEIQDLIRELRQAGFRVTDGDSMMAVEWVQMALGDGE